MATKAYSVKLSKTNEQEISKLSELLNEIEQISKHCDFDDYDDFKSEVLEHEDFYSVSSKYVKEYDDYKGFWLVMMKHLSSIHFQRILMNCSTMLDNCADPNLSHLDFKPDIKKGLELLENRDKSRNVSGGLSIENTNKLSYDFNCSYCAYNKEILG